MRYDWRIDCRPTGYNHHRDVVSQASESADHTGEFGLRRTIGFVNVTTSRAGAACISGINQEHRRANPFSFVRHEGAKLEERPTMQGCPLGATSRDPLAYSAQIFQDDRSTCVFRSGYQYPANAVVGVFGKTAFFSRQPLQFSFGRPCAFGLQFGPQAAVATAHVVDMTGRVYLSFAVHSDIGNTQIHAQRAFNVNGLWFVYVTFSRKEEHSLIQPQIAFPLLRLKQFQLPLSTDKGDTEPPVHCPNQHGLILQPPGQDAVIIGNTAACRFECAFALAVKKERGSSPRFGGWFPPQRIILSRRGALLVEPRASFSIT